MIKNIFLLIISIVLGILIIVLGFLWISPRNSQVLKIILPQSLFSLENAPTDSLVGEVASMSGKVAWQSRIAPVAILINSPIKLQQGEEVDTYEDGNATLNFPQFAVITASSNTQIGFIQTLPEDFVVEQKQGLADYNKTGKNPVSIVALDLLINIDSGESTILVDNGNQNVTVTVNTGSVTVAFDNNENNTNVLSVKSGNEYIFNDNTKMGIVKKL